MFKIRIFAGIAFGIQQTEIEIDELYNYQIIITDIFFCCINFQHVKIKKT
jgi:hypothetical protein